MDKELSMTITIRLRKITMNGSAIESWDSKSSTIAYAGSKRNEQLNNRTNKSSDVKFKVSKVYQRKLALKSKAIHFKNYFIDQALSSSEAMKFKDKLVYTIKKDKQNYNKEHLDLFLDKSILDYITETINEGEGKEEEKERLIQIFTQAIKIGGGRLLPNHKFIDMYRNNLVNELFIQVKSKKSWGPYKSIPLDQLIEAVNPRNLTKEAVSKRTEKIKNTKLRAKEKQNSQEFKKALTTLFSVRSHNGATVDQSINLNENCLSLNLMDSSLAQINKKDFQSYSEMETLQFFKNKGK